MHRIANLISRRGGPLGNAISKGSQKVERIAKLLGIWIVVGDIFDLHGTANQKQSISNYYNFADSSVAGNGDIGAPHIPPYGGKVGRYA